MGLKYLIDSNICIYIMNETSEKALNRYRNMQRGEAGISVITHGELLTGANKSNIREKVLARLSVLTRAFPALPLPADAADYYGKTRATLEKKGQPIGNNDLWIAAHALS